VFMLLLMILMSASLNSKVVILRDIYKIYKSRPLTRGPVQRKISTVDFAS
jgi:hypothetical protein